MVSILVSITVTQSVSIVARTPASVLAPTRLPRQSRRQLGQGKDLRPKPYPTRSIRIAGVSKRASVARMAAPVGVTISPSTGQGRQGADTRLAISSVAGAGIGKRPWAVL